jgi:hypothetical protein
MHFGAAAYMKQRPPAPDEPRIETPQWALDRCGDIAREMVARIDASGVRVIGDLEELIVVPTSGLAGDRQPDVCIPPGISSAMAMGVAVVSGTARGNPRVNDLAARGGSVPAAGTPHTRNAEPQGLGRFSTYHLAGTIGLRLGSGLLRRLDRLTGRAWSGHTSATQPASRQVELAIEAFDGWLKTAGLPRTTRDRLRSGALAGPRWVSTPTDGDEKCIRPGIAASLSLGVLVATGLALDAGSGRLRAARLPWAEPPELAVVRSRDLVGVVVRRFGREIARRLGNR